MFIEFSKVDEMEHTLIASWNASMENKVNSIIDVKLSIPQKGSTIDQISNNQYGRKYHGCQAPPKP